MIATVYTLLYTISFITSVYMYLCVVCDNDLSNKFGNTDKIVVRILQFCHIHDGTADWESLATSKLKSEKPQLIYHIIMNLVIFLASCSGGPSSW